MSIQISRFCTFVFASFLLAACGPQARVLRVTAIPDKNPDLLLEKQDKLQDWLGAKLGVEVEVTPVSNYQAAVTAVVSGKVDLAWLGGVTTVKAMQQSKGGVMPLITRASDLEFRSYFIVGEGVEAKTLKDLKGRSFTFGGKSSTSGRVMPQYFMQKDFGIADPQSFFKTVAFSGAHDKTAEDVANGTVDAGVLNYKTYDNLVAAGKLDKSKARILWTTPNYVDYSWAVRGDLDEKLGAGITAKIKAAFLGLDSSKPEDKAILLLQSCERYVAADASAWDGIKSVLDAIDLER